MIVIFDYSVGNVLSIKNMLKKIGQTDVCISCNPNSLKNANKIILPGVGNFDYAIDKLNQTGCLNLLYERVFYDKIPILGICLGAQLLMEFSEEGNKPGLGWIKGHVKRFCFEGIEKKWPIPNMGWCDVASSSNDRIVNGLKETAKFYFVHSYHIVCNSDNVLFTSNYGYEFTAGVYQNNIYGVQFHPEKSHKYGMNFLRNFSLL